jgi:hypothetical protein
MKRLALPLEKIIIILVRALDDVWSIESNHAAAAAPNNSLRNECGFQRSHGWRYEWKR